MKRLLSWIKGHYDKLIAFAILIGLLVSLVYLAVMVGNIQHRQAQWDNEIASERPRHPTVDVVNVTMYEQASVKVEQPFQIQGWSNSLFVPEDRVWCIDCKRPIPMNADKCPFCDAPNPPDPESDPNADIDQDGMLNGWEIEHGLSIRDAADASRDTDRDGFNNWEEFSGGTDPNEPNSYPPVEYKLQLSGKIRSDPFSLLFKAVSRLPDDTLQFQLNVRQGGKTYFRKMGEEVEGFKLVKFEPKTVEKAVGGGTVKQEVDVSVLTLQRGDRQIPLEIGQKKVWTEQMAGVLFTLDNTTYQLKEKDEFALKDKKYKVIKIDTDQDAVVIEREFDNRQFTIGRKIPGKASDEAAR